MHMHKNTRFPIGIYIQGGRGHFTYLVERQIHFALNCPLDAYNITILNVVWPDLSCGLRSTLSSVVL